MNKNFLRKMAFPSEKYVIQGIIKPTNKPKKKLSRKNNLKNKPKHFSFCCVCDFFDKQINTCLVKRLSHVCPYHGDASGYVYFKKGGEKF